MTEKLEVSPLREIENTEQASLTVGFDKVTLAKLVPESVFDDRTWEREAKIARLEQTLEVYKRLPERLHFDAGITAIFGDNGAGKTLLADIVIMAIHMEVFRQGKGLSFDDDILPKYRSQSGKFIPQLPGRLHSGPDAYGEDEHRAFVSRLAACMRVHEAALFSKDKYDLADANRSPAALGNVAVGMSSRQAVDYVKNDKRHFRFKPSIIMQDEPELGLSPRRQLTLVEELTAQASTSGAVELVPSNSIVLFESDVPRIDLDFPEKGIHRP